VGRHPAARGADMARDWMARHESFLFLMRGERDRMDRLGLPAASLIEALQASIDAYRLAARARREGAMRTARKEADRQLARCIADVMHESEMPLPP